MYIETCLIWKKTVPKPFNSIYKYVNKVLSINNPSIAGYVNVIYISERDIKDTTNASSYAYI